MSFNLIKIFHDMDLFARCVVGLLVAMAVASLAVFVERLWGLGRARRQSRRFGEVAGDLLSRGAYEEVIAGAAGFRGSPLAAMLQVGLRTYLDAYKKPGKLSAIELVKRELARKGEAQSAEIRRGMSVLASVGSVAPFVGLLGTVVGIIAAFQGIAREGSGGLGAVSAGIAEALVVTALGLVVAIPAVLAFNFLSARADAVLLALEQSRGEFIDHLEAHGKGLNLPEWRRPAHRDDAAHADRPAAPVQALPIGAGAGAVDAA